jgi:hypothetical protein
MTVAKLYVEGCPVKLGVGEGPTKVGSVELTSQRYELCR